MRTNRNLRKALVHCGLAVVLLLGAGAANALVILDPALSTRAIGITNLDVSGTLYNVSFVGVTDAASEYGDPGVFDFTTSVLAQTAVNAASAALNLATMVEVVGPLGGNTNAFNKEFAVAWNQTTGNPVLAQIFKSDSIGGGGSTWSAAVAANSPYVGVGPSDGGIWARFTPVPEPGTALLMGLGFAGLGVFGRSRREGSGETA
jgi:hypothetical protein